ncbi:germ cell nuclear acidic protein isoform X2 [Neoarius graeffei]|uniref:germ cell nuclear acidic protein isoform X2 n=1 Tax=Neoarius graeffei TaxID=443677 RepID=UPI00298BE00E|nr:germ cell nuclear acidic protein isoform X2 [Neoarius graeffei]
MEPSTQRLFERVAEKLGWDKPGALDRAADEESAETGNELERETGRDREMTSGRNRTRVPRFMLRKSLKSRRDAVGSCDTKAAERKESLFLSDSDGSDKENRHRKKNVPSSEALLDSSDEDFNQILATKATPKPAPRQISSVKKTREPVPILSSDSDDGFENFLRRVKTPKAQPRSQSVIDGDDSLKNFIVDDLSSDDDDDFVVEKKPSISKAKLRTPKSNLKSERQRLSQFDSPVFLSDSDDDSDVFIKTQHRRLSSQEKDALAKENKPRNALCCPSLLASVHMPTPSSAPPTHSGWHEDTGSSEDEFQSLLDRIKKKQNLGNSSAHASPKPPEPKAAAACVTPSVKTTQKDRDRVTVKASRVPRTPVQLPISRPVSQTEPRAGHSSRVAVCKTPGCFLQSLSFPESVYCRNFKQNKEELTSKLYQLYNTTVFESKLPTDMSIKWNTKMRKTAGYCITGQERVNGVRYARIELSVKVCDSADRLRDTLIHEMCHAATWLMNNVRDGHGPFWKVYARKATLVHPELPMVTRCHSYDINYKYQYQCNRCKNTIGRHSKSLDTERFVCALCTGQLVLLTPSNSRGPTPFATFVKENYGTVRQELAGQSHAEVMRKLSADFASKTHLSQS